MKSYDIFEKYLESDDFPMERVQDEDGVFFRTEQRTENGANIVVVVSFYDSSEIVDVEIYNLAKLNSPLKEEKFLYLLNELNRTSRFTKYILNSDNDVKLFYSFLTDENFTMESASRVFNSMIMLYRSAEEAYPKFMKLQWA